MKIFDAHCDTASELLNKGEKLFENTLHIDFKRLNSYTDFTQVFAVFISPDHYTRPMDRAKEIITNFCNEASACNITICQSYTDLLSVKSGTRAILSLEGGEPIKTMDDLHLLHSLGIRMIAPTWNHSNQLASGIDCETDTGLTQLGREIIREMDRLGIILDVSHLSEKSFWDASEITTRPICASHSNLRSVINHRRNLTDEQFLRIKSSGGVVGINLYPPFFGDNISMLKNHIDAFLSLGGEDNIGLGCDFDGVDFLPSGVTGVADLEKIIAGLNYPMDILEKFTHKNFFRLIQAHNC